MPALFLKGGIMNKLDDLYFKMRIYLRRIGAKLVELYHKLTEF